MYRLQYVVTHNCYVLLYYCSLTEAIPSICCIRPMDRYLASMDGEIHQWNATHIRLFKVVRIFSRQLHNFLVLEIRKIVARIDSILRCLQPRAKFPNSSTITHSTLHPTNATKTSPTRQNLFSSKPTDP